jgi:hypothetical protein
MKVILFKGFLLGLLVMFAGKVEAQSKKIILSESLEANSNPLKVKMGTQWMGKIWKIKFGEYAVVESKMGWIKTSSKSNLLNTKTESKATQKFAFTISDKTGDSAKVNAATDIEVKTLQETELFPFWIVGENEILLNSHNFTAFININQDTSEIWSLFMNVTLGSTVEDDGYAFLSNGRRKIFINSVSSNRNEFKSQMLPALGYEFVENEEPLCALQYYGGGAFGMNKNIVWIHNRLDSKMKLILAAAMTSLIQLKN